MLTFLGSCSCSFVVLVIENRETITNDEHEHESTLSEPY